MNKRKNVGLPHQQREKYKENLNNMKQSREKKQGRMGYKRNKLRWQRRNQTDRLAQIGLWVFALTLLIREKPETCQTHSLKIACC